MANIKRRSSPVDYRMCNQTVTIYHRGENDTYTRKIIKQGAFLEFRKNQNVDKTGSKETNSFLLVIPGATIPVEVGDKVMRGEGPEIADRAAWARLIPATTPGLVVVKYVDPKFWKDVVVHTEAGG